ncbi:MAG: hypothetical protein HKN47_01790 [Pirellulaceae bacterium]|nr:hypothetical protein [Pirellulaceae bacterium]
MSESFVSESPQFAKQARCWNSYISVLMAACVLTAACRFTKAKSNESKVAVRLVTLGGCYELPFTAAE